ncbi:hypothetical protein [Streptomyces zaomyceticus]|uniref:hypothetical protein n=1 Tax=Streptomyces zaomyceticus TaxID=68286 RepID=UPI0036CB426B
MKTWRLVAMSLSSAAILLATACGASDGKAPGTKPTASTSTLVKQPASEGSGATAKAVPAGLLALGNDPKIGPVVTDMAGFTIYRFTQDGQKPPKSACEGECAKLWPPVPAQGAQLPPGLDPTLLGSLDRPDGTKQLTLAGIPAYRYTKDTKPGQINGEGVGGTWFASLPKEGVPGLTDALGQGTGGKTGYAPQG